METQVKIFFKLIGFSSCVCDLTVGGCDPFCCCDKDCSKNQINTWKLELDHCAEETSSQQIPDLSECYDRTVAGRLNDL